MDAYDGMLYFSYGLVVVATIGAFLVPLVLAFTTGSLKGLMKGGLGVVVILVVFGISYAIAGDEVTPRYELFDIDAASSKKIGGGLIMTYIFMAVAFVGMVFTEVSRFLK